MSVCSPQVATIRREPFTKKCLRANYPNAMKEDRIGSVMACRTNWPDREVHVTNYIVTALIGTEWRIRT